MAELRDVCVDLAEDLAAWLEAIQPHCSDDFNESQALLARARDAIAAHDNHQAMSVAKHVAITSLSITVGLAIGVGLVLNMPYTRCPDRPVATITV